jgi:DNA-binding CsgD family transcriptional regulator
VAFVSVLVDAENPAVLNNKDLIILPHHLLLFVIDPKDQPIAHEEIVVKALGCTPSEAKLAQSLMVGIDLHAHAKKEGIAYNTGRRHLQSLFDKTETSSQVELVRRLIQTFGLLK